MKKKDVFFYSLDRLIKIWVFTCMFYNILFKSEFCSIFIWVFGKKKMLTKDFFLVDEIK